MFESNSNNFLKTLFKETQPILLVNFIWKKNKNTDTLDRMLKKKIQDFKNSHHCPTVWVELGRNYIQVLKQSTLECSQGENET